VRYDFTTDLAAFNPPRLVDQHLLVSLHGRQAEIDRFLGVLAGVTPIKQYRSPRNALRLLGARGLAKIAAANRSSTSTVTPLRYPYRVRILPTSGASPTNLSIGSVGRVDDRTFAGLFERYRGELRVHCYRMLGAFDETEDLVQEVFLRAWRGRNGFQGRSSIRAWLYRIATNACLDVLDGRARRVLPHHVGPPSDQGQPQSAIADVRWLQPFPDHLREPVAPRSDEPEAAVVAKETLELAFLAAIQHLPPRQRAAVILHDVLGWPARQTAQVLDGSVASVNSALQRARATLREHLPPGRADWAPSAPPTADERRVLHRYMSAVEQGDLAVVAELLARDVRTTMPPYPVWFAGREAVLRALSTSWDASSPGYVGAFRMLPTGANGQLAAAAYVRGPAQHSYAPFAIGVLQVEHGRITEITAFHEPAFFPAFLLPPRLTDELSPRKPSQQL